MALGNSFKKLQKLQVLRLHIMGCLKINNLMLNLLGKGLLDLPKLKQIHIMAWQTSIDKTGKKEFQRLFTNQPLKLAIEI